MSDVTALYLWCTRRVKTTGSSPLVNFYQCTAKFYQCTAIFYQCTAKFYQSTDKFTSPLITFSSALVEISSGLIKFSSALVKFSSGLVLVMTLSIYQCTGIYDISLSNQKSAYISIDTGIFHPNRYR